MESHATENMGGDLSDCCPGELVEISSWGQTPWV